MIGENWGTRLDACIIGAVGHMLELPFVEEENMSFNCCCCFCCCGCCCADWQLKRVWSWFLCISFFYVDLLFFFCPFDIAIPVLEGLIKYWKEIIIIIILSWFCFFLFVWWLVLIPRKFCIILIFLVTPEYGISDLS